MKLAAKMMVLDRAERREVDLPGTLRSGPEPFDIVIQDLSAGGFRGSKVEGLSIGDEVSVATPALGTQNARLTWSKDGQQGFSFDRDLPQGVVGNASRIDTVVAGPFQPRAAAQSLDPEGMPEPIVDKWPAGARLLLLLGGAALSWGAIVMVIMRS